MDTLLGLSRSLAQADSLPFWIFTAVGAALALASFGFGFVRIGRARLMEDTPTSRIRSAAQGYVELQGHARLLPGPTVISPLSQSRCCWWRYRIEQRRTGYSGGKAQSEWVVIDRRESDDLFLLVDDSGECIVDPVGARVIPSLSRQWRGYHPRPQQVPARSPMFSIGNYRYTEELLQYGDPLYALGQFSSQTAVRADDEAQDMAHLLGQWKRDRRELLRRFDANGDGEIDLQEWEAARRAAQQQVRAEQVERSVQPDLHILGKPTDRRPFILSSKSQDQLTRGDRWGGLAGIVVGIGLGLFVALVLMARLALG